MHARKSPLQILQSLTQKNFTEPYKTKNSLLIGDVYQNKSDKPNASNHDNHHSKKTKGIDLSKGTFAELNLSLLPSQSETNDRSASKDKRPTSKRGSFHLEKLQYIAGKTSHDMKSTLRDTSNTSNGEQLPYDKKNKEVDVNRPHQKEDTSRI